MFSCVFSCFFVCQQCIRYSYKICFQPFSFFLFFFFLPLKETVTTVWFSGQPHNTVITKLCSSRGTATHCWSDCWSDCSQRSRVSRLQSTMGGVGAFFEEKRPPLRVLCRCSDRTATKTDSKIAININTTKTGDTGPSCRIKRDKEATGSVTKKATNGQATGRSLRKCKACVIGMMTRPGSLKNFIDLSAQQDCVTACVTALCYSNMQLCSVLQQHAAVRPSNLKSAGTLQ